MAHPSSEATSFAELCVRTARMAQALAKPLLFGALCFAMVVAVVAGTMDHVMLQTQDKVASEHGISWQELNTIVDDKLQYFTDADAEKLLARMDAQRHSLTPEVLPKEEAAVFDFLIAITPWVGGSFLLIGLIFFVASIFFLLIATGPLVSPYERIQKLPGLFLPMCGLALWFFVRSLVWIPLIGFVFAAYMIPRLILAPVIFSNSGKGILKSLRESMQRTKGNWFMVFFCLLGEMFLMFVLLWLSLFAVAGVSLLSPKLAVLVLLFSLMVVLGLKMFFLTQLTFSMDSGPVR